MTKLDANVTEDEVKTPDEPNQEANRIATVHVAGEVSVDVSQPLGKGQKERIQNRAKDAVEEALEEVAVEMLSDDASRRPGREG